MKEFELKYGCNPNQKPARVFMADGSDLPFAILSGRPGYINFLDAFNSYQLVKELKEATGMPCATSFKHVSPTSAAVGSPLPEALKKACFVDDIEGMDDSPLACAYARARGTDRMSSFGDFIALSDVCDVTTAKLVKREVSDGIIAPGYEPEALEIMKSKRKGNYNIIQIDPAYVPAKLEHKQVYGVTFEQGRNDFKIDAALLQNIVTKNKALPESAVRDLIVALITLKYTQSNSVCYAVDGQAIGVGAGAAVPHPLHPAGRQQGRHLAPAPARKGAGPAVLAHIGPAGARQRHRRVHFGRRRGRARRRRVAAVLYHPPCALYQRGAKGLFGHDLGRFARQRRLLSLWRQHRPRPPQRRDLRGPARRFGARRAGHWPVRQVRHGHGFYGHAPVPPLILPPLGGATSLFAPLLPCFTVFF